MTYKYITIEDAFITNARRHERRACNWFELGYDDRAKRSLEKAKKNYDKAAQFDKIEYDPIFKRLNEMIENDLLYGYPNG